MSSVAYFINNNFHLKFQGAGAFGYFEVTHDITKFCGAKIFEKVGKRTVSCP